MQSCSGALQFVLKTKSAHLVVKISYKTVDCGAVGAVIGFPAGQLGRNEARGEQL